MMKKDKIIVVCGPTATGKSAYAIELAKKISGEIISADSRQVYTGLDLGTGKVTKEEMDGIPHHLLDVADPREQFSVADFVKAGEKIITEIIARGNVPIVCGGTGFYIDALVSGISLPEVPPNEELREKLSTLSLTELLSQLEEKDPERAITIDRDNKIRIIRALEIVNALGKVPAVTIEPRYTLFTVGLDMPDEILKERIAIRLKERLEHGMLTEAENLHAQGLTWKRMEELGLEYRSMSLVLQEKIDMETFVQDLKMDIWHYAKRQRTWFKRNKNIHWINPLNKEETRESLLAAQAFISDS